jgi:hypothetical protein
METTMKTAVQALPRKEGIRKTIRKRLPKRIKARPHLLQM